MSVLLCQRVTVYLNETWGYTLNEELMSLCKKCPEQNNQGKGCVFCYFLQTKNDGIWIRSGWELIGEVSLERTEWCFLGLVLFSLFIQATAVCRVSKCFSIKHLFCLFYFFVSTDSSLKHPAFTHHAHQSPCKKLLHYKSNLYYCASLSTSS